MTYETDGHTSTSRNLYGAIVGTQGHTIHRGQVDHDATAQRATGPVVTAATHRKRKIAVARSPDRRLHVLRGGVDAAVAQIAVAAA